MQQPPGPKGPQILYTRPANEWINRVGQKHAELEKLALSEKARDSLRRLSESEFVYSTARLAGLLGDESSEAESRIAETLAALRIVEALAQSEGVRAALTPELLMRLNNPLGINESKFRMNAIAATGPFKPAPAEHIHVLIESVCRWLTAESFAELNPPEQASITHLRLLEIHPFERANLETALVAASLFTMRNRMPPIIIKQEDSSLYLAAVEEGARMNTRPMVELMARAMEKSLSEMIMAIKTKS
ncbi:MAG TPA: Fic family protein [Blastocatellia bacterium]|nr:Fic family protein [Blastocatellia bacterium]